MSILRSIFCTLTGTCDRSTGEATIAETERLITSIEDAWAPIKDQMRHDAKTRPNLAATLRDAHLLSETKHDR